MALTVDEVTRIAGDAARTVSPALEVVGVTLGGGADSKYIEVLININGCRSSPCRIEVGAFRDVADRVLQEDITRKLREHLASHGPIP
jgi:hypothetical protein